MISGRIRCGVGLSIPRTWLTIWKPVEHFTTMTHHWPEKWLLLELNLNQQRILHRLIEDPGIGLSHAKLEHVHEVFDLLKYMMGAAWCTCQPTLFCSSLCTGLLYLRLPSSGVCVVLYATCLYKENNISPRTECISKPEGYWQLRLFWMPNISKRRPPTEGWKPGWGQD